MTPVLRSLCRAVRGGLLLCLAALILGCAPLLRAQQQPSPLPAPPGPPPPPLAPPVLAPPALAPTAIKQITAGGGHTCVLTNAGAVRCWGDHRNGRVDGAVNISWQAVDVLGLDDVQALDAWNQSCALTADGRVLCWGTFSYTAQEVLGLGGVRAMSVGETHACAVTAAGGVKCWGWNNDGQLGDGTTEMPQMPVDVAGLEGSAKAVAAGGRHTCALMAAGDVMCWGANDAGQLGDGTNSVRTGPVAVVDLAGTVQAITAGYAHTCVLLVNGGAQCWGANGQGQLGAGTTGLHYRPADVVGLTANVRQIAAGYGHTCALVATEQGQGVQCWGAGGYGAAGDGSLLQRPTLTQVTGLDSGVAAIDAGPSHACALLESGKIKCWGDNASGQLGSVTLQQLLPVTVTELAVPVQAISAGEAFTCVLTGDSGQAGGVQCWGDNAQGELGDGGNTVRYRAAPVNGLAAGVQAIAAGRFHACALSVTGGVQCWGDNTTGQLGDGTIEQPRREPVGVIGLGSGLQAITAGRGHTCALTTGGGVLCWGDNTGGQLGDGTQLRSTQPVNVFGLSSGVRAVAAGLGLTCALTEGGGVRCWGAGPVGDSTRHLRATPAVVTGLSGVQAIAAGDWHACALTSRGGVKCWGLNESGQLGDGTRLDHLTPVDVAGLSSGVRMIDAGGNATCAVTADNAIWCWGRSRSTMFNYGDLAPRTAPMLVRNLTGEVLALAVGDNHSCVLVKAAGEASANAVQCWGYNFFGQLGVNPGWAPLEVLALLPRALFAPLVRQ